MKLEKLRSRSSKNMTSTPQRQPHEIAAIIQDTVSSAFSCCFDCQHQIQRIGFLCLSTTYLYEIQENGRNLSVTAFHGPESMNPETCACLSAQCIEQIALTTSLLSSRELMPVLCWKSLLISDVMELIERHGQRANVLTRQEQVVNAKMFSQNRHGKKILRINRSW